MTKQTLYQLLLGLYVFFALCLAHVPARACATNCGTVSDLKDIGFVIQSENASPLTKVNYGFLPSSKIKNPENATVIIWLHGQTNPRKRQACSARHNQPPPSVLQLGKEKNTFIHYHCSSVIDKKIIFEKDNVPDDGIHYTRGYAMGYYTLGRRDELEDVIDDFLKMGVQPSNITISGHSAGGWTALLAAASYPEKFHAVIAFAPAFAGPRHEVTSYPWWRKIVLPEQIAMITQPNDVPKLVFAYEDDAFNRPSDLTFLTQAFPVSAKLIGQNCGRGHGTHRNDCQLDNTVSLMKDVIFGKKRQRQTKAIAKEGMLSSLTSLIYDATGYDLGKMLENLRNVDLDHLTIVKFLRDLWQDISEFFKKVMS